MDNIVKLPIIELGSFDLRSMSYDKGFDLCYNIILVHYKAIRDFALGLTTYELER